MFSLLLLQCPKPKKKVCLVCSSEAVGVHFLLICFIFFVSTPFKIIKIPFFSPSINQWTSSIIPRPGWPFYTLYGFQYFFFPGKTLNIVFGCSISNLLVSQLDALLPPGPPGQPRRRLGLSQICDDWICLSHEKLCFTCLTLYIY